MINPIKSALVALAFAGVATTAQSAIVMHNSGASLTGALGTVTVEDFNDTTLVPGLTIAGSASASISGGRFNDQVNGSPDSLFSFADAINGFGGTFDLTPGGTGSGIALTITLFAGGTQILSQQIVNQGGPFFFGFTSDVAFNAVQFSLGSGSGVETYNLDNLTFGATAVPEPMSLALVGLALVGAAGATRRGRRSQA